MSVDLDPDLLADVRRGDFAARLLATTKTPHERLACGLWLLLGNVTVAEADAMASASETKRTTVEK